MKNLVFIIVMVLSFSINASAAKPFINKMGDKTFVLDLSQWKSKTIEFTIKNESNTVIFTEKLTPKKGLRKYNLKMLLTGNYTVEVEDHFKVLSQKVKVSYNKIKIADTSKETFKPILKVYDGKLDLIYLAQGQSFSLAIVNQANETIYRKEVKGKTTYNKSFGLSNLKRGKYIAILYANSTSYTLDFEL